jgi:hypothetical protein
MNDIDQLFNIIGSYTKGQLLYVAAQLKLSDILAQGPKTSDEIAKKTDTNKDALYRVMRALSHIGLYKETGTRLFELAPMGELLQEQNESKLRMHIIFQLDEFSRRPWGELLYSVQTGNSAFEKIYHTPMFDYLAALPEKSKIFNDAFKVYTTWWAESFFEKYDFSPYDIIVDIGGSAGILIKTLLEKYPDKKGILFDLPHVIEEIREEFLQHEISNRCELVKGDFFEYVPGGGNLYILKNVIHDWDDEHALQILKNCHKAMVPQNTLVLAENVLIPGLDNLLDTCILDIGMLVGTVGGRERTKAEYEVLLKNAGFTPGIMTRDYVEGIKTG